MPASAQLIFFGLVDGPRGIGDFDLAAAELLEAAAGAGEGDVGLNAIGDLRELLGDRLGDREHGR